MGGTHMMSPRAAPGKSNLCATMTPVTRWSPARLLDSAGRPARFAVTAAPHGCGAVSVWVVDGAETCSPRAIADAGL